MAYVRSALYSYTLMNSNLCYQMGSRPIRKPPLQLFLLSINAYVNYFSYLHVLDYIRNVRDDTCCSFKKDC